MINLQGEGGAGDVRFGALRRPGVVGLPLSVMTDSLSPFQMPRRSAGSELSEMAGPAASAASVTIDARFRIAASSKRREFEQESWCRKA
jgi:hypothetical protein